MVECNLVASGIFRNYSPLDTVVTPHYIPICEWFLLEIFLSGVWESPSSSHTDDGVSEWCALIALTLILSDNN